MGTWKGPTSLKGVVQDIGSNAMTIAQLIGTALLLGREVFVQDTWGSLWLSRGSRELVTPSAVPLVLPNSYKKGKITSRFVTKTGHAVFSFLQKFGGSGGWVGEQLQKGLQTRCRDCGKHAAPANTLIGVWKPLGYTINPWFLEPCLRVKVDVHWK